MADAAPSLRFLTRPDCPLCEEAEIMLRRWAPRMGLGFEVVDIANVDDDATRYGDRIPVLLAESGRVLVAGRWRQSTLVAALLRA